MHQNIYQSSLIPNWAQIKSNQIVIQNAFGPNTHMERDPGLLALMLLLVMMMVMMMC